MDFIVEFLDSGVVIKDAGADIISRELGSVRKDSSEGFTEIVEEVSEGGFVFRGLQFFAFGKILDQKAQSSDQTVDQIVGIFSRISQEMFLELLESLFKKSEDIIGKLEGRSEALKISAFSGEIDSIEVDLIHKFLVNKRKNQGTAFSVSDNGVFGEVFGDRKESGVEIVSA